MTRRRMSPAPGPPASSPTGSSTRRRWQQSSGSTGSGCDRGERRSGQSRRAGCGLVGDGAEVAGPGTYVDPLAQVGDDPVGPGAGGQEVGAFGSDNGVGAD